MSYSHVLRFDAGNSKQKLNVCSVEIDEINELKALLRQIRLIFKVKVITILPLDKCEKTFTAKVSVQSSSSIYFYPIIRLLRELKTLAGKIVSIYETEYESERTLLL